MLDWREDHGFLAVVTPPEEVYNNDYFEKYIGYAATQQGRDLTRARVAFVTQHVDSGVLDFGVGSGDFLGALDTLTPTFGYDINPYAIQYLKSCERFAHYNLGWDAMTFWDSLEHLEHPEEVLKHVKNWAFVSIPIFRDKEHALASKHYRPDEHWWYYTETGFIRFMNRQGFALQARSGFEIDLGREDIWTYAFRRIVI